MRLVLAEDHALLRDGLIRLLEAHGCEVVRVLESADGLVDAMVAPDVDAAVVDVRLPADVHRRGAPGGAGGPRPAGRASR